MKNIIALTLLCLLPSALRAEGPALDQLTAVPAAASALTEVPAATPDKGTQVLVDPATGKAHVVIPVGGGFVYAQTGKFQPAVFNGSGYVLPDGRFLALAGSRGANPENNLTGRWIGWGEWTYQGSGTRCDVMTLTFEDGKDYLDRKGGYFDCGMVSLAVEPARFVKKGTQLLDQGGAAVGTYENSVITLTEPYSESVDIFTTIKRDGLHFDYSEIWRLKDGSELYNITGRLFTGG